MVDIEKLRALLAAATPGPWECVLSGPAPRIEAVDKRRGMRAAGDPHPVIARMPKDYAPTLANGDIIAAAVNALPELLDEVERLRMAETQATEWRQHTAALIAAMKTWGSWGDGVPSAEDCGEVGKVGAAFDAALAALKGGE